MTALAPIAKQSALRLTGVSENNLKALSVVIPHNQLVCITGVSGSGKSTLAFDTIYAEGGRRYIETFSPYTRQYLERLHRPDIDTISGIRPAIALEQRNRVTSSRSTVGTLTDVNEYLKVIWTHLGKIVCPQCAIEVTSFTPHQAAHHIVSQLIEAEGEQALVAFPVFLDGQASLSSVAATLQAEGLLRYFCPVQQKVKSLDELCEDSITLSSILGKGKKELLVVLDRIRLEPKQLGYPSSLLLESLVSAITQAQRFSQGFATIILLANSLRSKTVYLQYSDRWICQNCTTEYKKPRPGLFSFNSPLGACGACRGFGHILAVDPDLCVPNPSLSIVGGALACWNSKSTRRELRALIKFCEQKDIDTSIAWHRIPKRNRELIFNSTKRDHGFVGINAWFAKLQRKIYKMHVRVFLSRYRRQVPCSTCHATRLVPEASLVTVNGLTLPKLWQLSLERVEVFMRELLSGYRGEEFAQIALEEVVSRVGYLVNIGLGYLTLDRQSKSLSGGESQRVNLTSILGARLVDTILVLDEPSIGLHSRDTARLLEILKQLRDRGNTVIVVEHDKEIIRACDHIIDLGPRAGGAGGEIVFEGEPLKLGDEPRSVTGTYLYHKQILPAVLNTNELTKVSRAIQVIGACAHNLKNIDITIPLGKFVVLTGVSGSGKSSLVTKCLVEPYERLKQGLSLKMLTSRSDAAIEDLRGLDKINDLILIDQSPVGKTPRSNPATYTKVWEIIRDSFAETLAAQRLGISKTAFSFNAEGGRCPHCRGAGAIRVEMQFLADVFVECEFCSGTRFKEKVLEVTLGGKTIVDFLAMSLEESLGFFSLIKDDDKAEQIRARLSPLLDLGLGYLRLGQPLSELSGGEAQRLKISTYLDESAIERCLFVLDEPTTGLSPFDIENLLIALRKLIAKGHSILCIEHNLDVIARADWMIDLGPEGGERGGEVLVTGHPQLLLNSTESIRRSETVAALRREREVSLGTIDSTDKSVASPANRSVQPASTIDIVGARENNLRNISVQIPKGNLTVITGVSGSGKSTLAFDILFAEGQRRYIDCLSPYARQFITQMRRPDVDRVTGIPPTVALSQKTAPPLGLSTLATTTELYQYLRLLYAKVGTQLCPDHRQPIVSFSVESITEELLARYAGKRVFLFAPVVSGRKGSYTELFDRAYKAEISEARIDDEIVSIASDLRLQRHKLHWISLLVASLSCTEKNRAMLQAAIEQSLLLGSGTIELSLDKKSDKPIIFSSERMCPTCKRGFRQLDPQDFSFRSKRGVCANCSGRGVVGHEKDSQSLHVCEECRGARIGPLGRNVLVGGKAIHEVVALTPPQASLFLKQLKFDRRLAPVVEPILSELVHRLETITAMGLGYLSLARESSTLSGGEGQRLRLARTLGSPLTGLCYVLDEPTIGLHPSDHDLLMETLFKLRDLGNSVVVVEHDEETIIRADHIIDVGPAGGRGGGGIVAIGQVGDIIANEHSVTGQMLQKIDRERRARLCVSLPLPVGSEGQMLEIGNVSTNNLKNVTAEFPIGKLTVVAGVSGAGKSSLIRHSLLPAMNEYLSKSRRRSLWKLRNAEKFHRVLEIDQTPIGRTSSSIPASFLGVFDEIRKVFARLPEAAVQGWSAGHFSFNSKGGRCEPCRGRGELTIPMTFLPEARTVCEHCNGKRYRDDTLAVRFHGFSISDILDKTIEEAQVIFANHVRVRRLLDVASELGLGYLTLGQATSSLSGGEAQRLKIAKELGSREASQALYILDEPTTGLHMLDIEKLMNVLKKLTALGNTVVVIEHNLEVICRADHLIELGPGPGDSGGDIIFSGKLRSLISETTIDTPTKRALNREHNMPKARSLAVATNRILEQTYAMQ